MFTFGKKRPDERTLGMIAIELSMYMRWVEEHCGRMLMPDDAKDVARRILTRENFKIDEQDLFFIFGSATTQDIKQIDAFREKTGFDSTIDGFCASIDIPKPKSAKG
jgi:hypothetical protein